MSDKAKRELHRRLQKGQISITSFITAIFSLPSGASREMTFDTNSNQYLKFYRGREIEILNSFRVIKKLK